MTHKYTHAPSATIAQSRTSGPYKLTVRLVRTKLGGGHKVKLTRKGQLVRTVPAADVRLVRELFADLWTMSVLFHDHNGARLAVEQLAADIGLPTNDDEVGDDKS